MNFSAEALTIHCRTTVEESFTALSSAMTILEDLQLKKAKSAPQADKRNFFAKQ